MKLFLTLVFFISSFVFFNGCKSDDVFCTMEFRMITVSIMDSNNSPIELDSFFVTLDKDTVMTKENSHWLPDDSSIIIFSDSEMEKTTEKGKTFKLTGYLNGALVVDENYLIAHDKCHVELKSGKTVIILP